MASFRLCLAGGATAVTSSPNVPQRLRGHSLAQAPSVHAGLPDREMVFRNPMILEMQLFEAVMETVRSLKNPSQLP